MEKQSNYKVESIGDKIIYVEPNLINGGGEYNVPVSLEDLSVYVELKVECKQTRQINKIVDGQTFVLQFNMKQKEPFVSLHNGTNFDNSNNVFLSTDGYGNYTLDSLKESGTDELFGVESIDISYNSFSVPEVVIKFVDVKGAALHGAEELVHDENGLLSESVPLSSKFLSCFFTVPYPKFVLTVKGYYGKPVYYDLTASEFRSSFNSKSGNYDVTVKLVGYPHALISDVQMCSLLAAPYSKYHGKDYWETQVSNGNFTIDGNKMLTLQELVAIWNDNISNIKPLGEYEIGTQINYASELDKCIVVESAITDLLIGLDSVKVMIKEVSYVAQDGYIETTKKSFLVDKTNKLVIEYNEKIDDAVNNESFIKVVNLFSDTISGSETVYSYDPKDILNSQNWELYNEKDLSNINVSDDIKESLPKKEDGKYNFKFFNFQKQIDSVSRQKERINSKMNSEIENQESIINDQIKDILGFSPTIENITRICFAHLETFLNMYEYVGNKVANGSNYDVFPKILTEKINENGIKTTEETWIGDVYDDNREEVKFVNGIIDGIKSMQEEANFLDIVEEDIIYVHPNDLFEEHPFRIGFKNGFNNEVYLKRIYQTVCDPKMHYLYSHPSVSREVALQDANTFKRYNPNGYNGVASNLISGVYNDLNKNVDFKKYGFKHKVNVYDINDPLLYNKKLLNSENGNLNTITLNADNGWSSDNFAFGFFFNDKTAMVAKISDNPNEVSDCKHKTVVLSGGTDIKIDASLNYNNIKRQHSEDDIVEIRARKLGGVEKFLFSSYKIKKNLNKEEYTILTIPSLALDLDNNIDKINVNKVCTEKMQSNFLFSEAWYQNCGDIYTKAAMFLETFEWGGGIDKVIKYLFFQETKGKVLNASKAIEAVPYYVLLTIGAALYSFDKKDGLLIYSYQGNYNQYHEKVRFKWDTDEIRNCLNGNLTTTEREKLKSLFTNWVTNTYNGWDDVFMKEETKLKNNVNADSDLYYVTLTYNIDSKNSNNNDYYRSPFTRLFKETNPIVQEMTKQFFKLCWLVKYGTVDNGYVEVKDDYVSKLLEELFDPKTNSVITPQYGNINTYAESFQNTMNSLFNFQVEELRSNYSKGVKNAGDFIKLNLYRYLKQIWDRWILNESNDYNDWKMHDVFEGDKKRLHFIDPSYNDVGNLILVDIGKFVELIMSCIEQKDIEFLSFLSFFYKDNNFTLHNVQNFMNWQKEENFKTIFEPISASDVDLDNVKKFSDLVVLYSPQSAESQEDSFDINDEVNLPDNFKQGFGNYNIPAFGVTYGMQNQNYFVDIDVSMDNPNVTDQVIQATFQIADENYKNGASDTVSKIRSVGQDMYRVYSNHAYQCGVTMMGCAWVQPLMYFQLLNIPLFRGAYIIHKVTHNITPNNMVTKIVGTKVSRISMSRLENSYYFTQRNINGKPNTISESQFTAIDNDCNYSMFLPYVDDTTHTSKLNILKEHFNDYWYIDGDNKMTYNTLYGFVLYDVSNSDLIKQPYLYQYLNVLLHNVWSHNKEQMDTKESCLEFFNKLLNENKILSLSVLDLKNKKETFERYNKHANKKDIDNISIELNKCFDDVEKYVHNFPINKGLEQIDGCDFSRDVDKESDIVCSIGDVSFLRNSLDGGTHFYFGVMNKTKTDALTFDSLLNSMNSTLKKTQTLSSSNLIIAKDGDNVMKYESGNVRKAFLVLESNADDKIKNQIFDMILQTYSQYLKTLSWVVSNKDSGQNSWEYICIELTDNSGNFNVTVSYLNQSKKNELSLITINDYKNLNVNFYMSLIKKYKIVKKDGLFSSIDNKTFKNSCLNFSELNKDSQKWESEVLSFLNGSDITKNITIKDCDDILTLQSEKVGRANNSIVGSQSGVPYGQSFKGVQQFTTKHNDTKDQLLKLNNVSQASISETDPVQTLFLRYGYSETKGSSFGERLGKYAHDHIAPKGKDIGRCAFYVRKALEGAFNFKGVFKFNTKGHPCSACSYWDLLDWWGFQCIYYGMSSQYNGGYENGDIIISAGLINGPRGEKDKHGHIQIYYGGKWYCYKGFDYANVYDTDRYCYIYRIPTSSDSSSNGSSVGVVSNSTYKASDNIIMEIEKIEGFMPIWYKDADSYSIGYGFYAKSWPKLVNEYPIEVGKNTCEENEIYNYLNPEKTVVGAKSIKMREAHSFMITDVIPRFEKEFRKIMGDMPNYSQNRLDALFSLMYNVGSGSFKNSPNLMAALKKGDIEEAAKQMDHGWDNSGVRKRREWEQKIFREDKFTAFVN